MTQISSTFNAPSLFSSRTANYVAALIREGDNFDYCKWLQRVREKEAQAKELQQPAVRIVAPNTDAPINALNGRETSLNGRRFNGQAPVPIGMRRSHRRTLHDTSNTRTERRFEGIRRAWEGFQASRTRDAVYGYLEVVFATVKHYKVRRRTKKLLQQAFKCADLPFDKRADPFAAVIRCTSRDVVDSKTISKWARALRYVARSRVPPTQLKMFMKQAGGVNACADRYAKGV